LGVVSELAGRRPAALASLERCLKIGYAVRELEADPELQGLRRDPRYQLAKAPPQTDEVYFSGPASQII
jgi:hypothetical protein